MPEVRIEFRLADLPEVGVFFLVSNSWELAGEVPALIDALGRAAAPRSGVLRCEPVHFTTRSGIAVSYRRPVVEIGSEQVIAAACWGNRRQLECMVRWLTGPATTAEQTSVIDALEHEATELSRQADLTIFFADGDALADAWNESTMQDRRMLLGCVMKSMTVAPARFQGDSTPIMDRISIEWVA
ncbi:hypothetical protein ACGFZL_11360 [Streptomyces sp. NPDC048182]|uniref:hypothetical protein n=1 Tax=Streptomyces sp. NPDC048182 TaxID=3365507 RepID=UPI0037243AAC